MQHEEIEYLIRRFFMKKIFTLVGMAAGVACIIFGIITFVLGGNAYTIDL